MATEELLLVWGGRGREKLARPNVLANVASSDGRPITWRIVDIVSVEGGYPNFPPDDDLLRGPSGPSQFGPGRGQFQRPGGNQGRPSPFFPPGADFSPRYHDNHYDGGNSSFRHRGGRSWNERDNTVCVNAILDGSDVRTTIMLRNIPNRMTDIQLKQIMDRCHLRGLYDFLYLRMDFRSGANVGYAFLNFTSPVHVAKMFETFQGQPWPIYHTGKLAEISYATSQGLEALIQKFRNSSVMRELVSCRPKLYHTFEDDVPMHAVGTEIPFPAPDNEQKLERSIQNAQNIGLFPPNGRGTGMNHHRDRHSMFDRGTPRDLASGAAQFLTQGNSYGPIAQPHLHYGNSLIQY